MDWRALLQSRWTWVAVAGGAGLAGIAWLARRRSGGGGSTVPGPDSAAGAGGYFDSSATDFARILGQYQAGTEVMLDQHRRAIEDRLAELLPETQTPHVPSSPPTPRPIPPRRPMPLLTPPPSDSGLDLPPYRW